MGFFAIKAEKMSNATLAFHTNCVYVLNMKYIFQAKAHLFKFLCMHIIPTLYYCDCHTQSTMAFITSSVQNSKIFHSGSSKCCGNLMMVPTRVYQYFTFVELLALKKSEREMLLHKCDR